MNIVLFPQTDNADSDSGGPPAVMTVIDARKFRVIATHWPTIIVAGAGDRDRDNQEVRHEKA